MCAAGEVGGGPFLPCYFSLFLSSSVPYQPLCNLSLLLPTSLFWLFLPLPLAVLEGLGVLVATVPSSKVSGLARRMVGACCHGDPEADGRCFWKSGREGGGCCAEGRGWACSPQSLKCPPHCQGLQHGAVEHERRSLAGCCLSVFPEELPRVGQSYWVLDCLCSGPSCLFLRFAGGRGGRWQAARRRGATGRQLPVCLVGGGAGVGGWGFWQAAWLLTRRVPVTKE